MSKFETYIKGDDFRGVDVSFGVDALLDVISDEEKELLIEILEKIGTRFQYPNFNKK